MNIAATHTRTHTHTRVRTQISKKITEKNIGQKKEGKEVGSTQ